MKNGELKIEKNVPLPKGRGHGLTDFLRKMKPGESVLVTPEISRDPRQIASGVARGKFVCRGVDGGIRIWRTK